MYISKNQIHQNHHLSTPTSKKALYKKQNHQKRKKQTSSFLAMTCISPENLQPYKALYKTPAADHAMHGV